MERNYSQSNNIIEIIYNSWTIWDVNLTLNFTDFCFLPQFFPIQNIYDAWLCSSWYLTAIEHNKCSNSINGSTNFIEHICVIYGQCSQCVENSSDSEKSLEFREFLWRINWIFKLQNLHKFPFVVNNISSKIFISRCFDLWYLIFWWKKI